MTQQLLLPDSNIFIESSRQHYPFDYGEFHAFWQWLEQLNDSGSIIMLDVVFNELTTTRRNDSKSKPDFLETWVMATFTNPVSHKTDEIGEAYSEILDYLNTCGLYSQDSFRQWTPEDKADPWLIAAAMTTGATIVTNEVPAHPSRQQQMKREPKIPDVAANFEARTILREFFDESGLLNKNPYPLRAV